MPSLSIPILSEKSNYSINFLFINAASANLPRVIDSVYLHLLTINLFKKKKMFFFHFTPSSKSTPSFVPFPLNYVPRFYS